MLDHLGFAVADYPRSRAFYERALAGESFGFEFSYPLPRKGGPPEVRHLEVQMLPLRNAVDQSVIGVTVFNKDVTQKRLLLAQLMELDRLVAIGTLAAGVGHEINNPLANISARAQSLLRDERDPERRRTLEAINQQALRAHEMISDLMLFARPPQPKLTACDAASILRTLASELAKLDHAAREGANRLMTIFRVWLARQFEAAGREPETADQLALHLLMRSQGVATLLNAFQDRAFVEREIAMMHAWVREHLAEH